MSWSSVVVSIAIVALLVGVNAFFVAGEFAIVRVRRTRLEELARENVEAASRRGAAGQSIRSRPRFLMGS